MIQYSIRIVKRFAVLIPGVLIAYFSVRNIFPYFESRLPLAFAIIITYALAAYVLIPASIRAFRIIMPSKHLPLYCVTPDGFASDPLNIGIIGTRRELITAMQAAGWHLADSHSIRNVVHEITSIATGRAYCNAPVSSLYLFGRKQDLAFEIPAKGGLGARHHVRFWGTTYEQDGQLSVHTIHWHRRQEHVLEDRLLWVGAASLDVGLNFIRHNLQITHMVDPDTDRERELIVTGLAKQKLAKKTAQVKLDNPYRLTNRVWRGYLHTDGMMTVVHLMTTSRRSRNRSR
jgi:hypothetical protein